MSKIQSEFDKIFFEYKNKKIAIYGTGNNARLLLENVSGYQFVNLVSKDNIGDIVFGKKVISLQEAIEISEMMIIAAVTSSTAIIYQRIKDSVPDNYPIYDIRGVRLSGAEQYRKNPYWETNEEQLRELIKQHDVISFDIFDTLVTRAVLEPKDIFLIVEKKLNENGKEIPFYKWRVCAEEECNRETVAPSFKQIYEKFKVQNCLSEEIVKEIMQLEYDIELELIRPRMVMKEIFEWTKSLEKQVYLTSDMYFSETDLLKILEKAGIHVDVPILVSSDYGKTKEEGSLFELLLEKSLGLSVLHIGDNYETDIKRARQLGINTFYVKRGYELLAESSLNFLVDEVKTVDDRRLLGALTADFCNNPFELSKTKGKLYIDSYRKLAWMIVPITILFMSEIVKNAGKYDRILFASRDGYFLYELYNTIYQKKDVKLPRGEYFYASRSAMSSASVFSEKDIEVLCNKIDEDRKLNLKNFLEVQFHIEVSDEFDKTVEEAMSQWSIFGLKERLKFLVPQILAVSAQKRQGYLQYIKNLGIKEDMKLAIVDIVTQGTLVFCLSNLLKREIDLLALGTACIPNKYISNEKNIYSVYGNVYRKIENVVYSLSELDELHLFLEMLYSSTEGQLFEFTKEGQPLMVKESEYNPILLKNTQSQIRNILDTLERDISNMCVSNEFALGCMKLLYSKYSDATEELKLQFLFNDPYGKQVNLGMSIV